MFCMKLRRFGVITPQVLPENSAGFELAPSGWDVPRDEFRLYVRADMISGPEAACCDDFDAVEYTQKE